MRFRYSLLKLSLKKQHGSNRIVNFYVFSKMTLCCSVLIFLWKDNMLQTKHSISKFSQKWDDVFQFSIFFENTRCFKPSSLVMYFRKNDITLLISQFFLKKNNMAQTNYLISNFLKVEITFFSSRFSLKRQHVWKQVVYLSIFSRTTLDYSVLIFLWKENRV